MPEWPVSVHTLQGQTAEYGTAPASQVHPEKKTDIPHGFINLELHTLKRLAMYHKNMHMD